MWLTDIFDRLFPPLHLLSELDDTSLDVARGTHKRLRKAAEHTYRPKMEWGDETSDNHVPTCDTCSVPVSNYRYCMHVPIAIRESEFDVSAGSRSCRHYERKT